MKTIKINASNEEIITAYKKLYQVCEIEDAVDGSLLDNYLLYTSNGYIAVVETYETSNSSVYTVCSGNDDEIISLWDEIKERKEEYEKRF